MPQREEVLAHLAAAFVPRPADPAGGSLLKKETLARRCKPCVDVAASDDPSVSSPAILPAFFCSFAEPDEIRSAFCIMLEPYLFSFLIVQSYIYIYLPSATFSFFSTATLSRREEILNIHSSD